jgi:hypothetical protein
VTHGGVFCGLFFNTDEHRWKKMNTDHGILELAVGGGHELLDLNSNYQLELPRRGSFPNSLF